MQTPITACCARVTRICAVSLLMVLLQPAFAGSLSTGLPATVPAPANNLDLRLLVDISGSMRRTDPNNLRQPAVTLFSELVPQGSQGGVWTFGRLVNMLVPTAQVDDAWRGRVQQAAEKINSVALFTNIGGALEVASDDFYRDQDFSNTHFILLTDGLVSIDGNEAANMTERQRILGPVIDRFVEKGARIHPIALSDEADLPLLEALAVETGGQFNIAHTDAQLTRAMLQAFTGAASSNEVALTDNRFVIDDSVEQFSALIFPEPGSGSIRLNTPSGETLSRNNRGDNLRWLSTREYDLITLDQPESGQWQITGLIGEQSRVMLVSQRRMVVSPLPRQFFASDTLPLSIAFYEDGELISDEDFLSKIQLTVEISSEDERSGTRSLDAPATGDGVFRDEMTLLRDPGLYQVLVRADGGSFNRSHRQSTTLRPAFDVELQGQGSGNESVYRLLLRPQDPGLDLASVDARLTLTLPDGSEEQHTLQANGSRTEWAAELSGQAGPGDYRLALSVQGETRQGLAVEQQMDSVLARFPREQERSSFTRITTAVSAAPVAQVAPPSPEPEPPAEPLFSPQPVKPPEPVEVEEPVPVESSGPQGLWWLAAAGLLALFAGLWWWRRRAFKESGEGNQQADKALSESGDSESDSDQEDAIPSLKYAIDTLDDADDVDLHSGEPPELEPIHEEPAPDSNQADATPAEDTTAVDDSRIPELMVDEDPEAGSDQQPSDEYSQEDVDKNRS